MYIFRGKKLLATTFKLVGFVDGAWKKKKDGIILAGGGTIKNSTGTTKFIFSWPIRMITHLDT